MKSKPAIKERLLVAGSRHKMMPINLRFLLLPVTILLMSTLLVPIDSSAASMKLDKYRSTLYVNGEIEKGDFERFMKGMRKHEFLPEFLSISSPGGDVETAMKFGRFVRRAAIQVRIENDGECNSACFLILVGGTERSFGAEVGIHRPYYDREIYSKLSPPEATEYFRNMNKSVRAYLAEMDVPIRLVDRMMGIESSEMEYLSPREIEDAIDTFAPSHEEWLLAKCGISLSDEPGSGSEQESTSLDQDICWSDSLSKYHDELLSEILAR